LDARLRSVLLAAGSSISIEIELELKRLVAYGVRDRAKAPIALEVKH
jgi:hypothetical protein